MNVVLKWIPVVFYFLNYVGERRKGVYIIGNVYPEIGQIGQDMILRCQVGGCTSSRLQVHLYKWEGSRNQTLYIHNSTKQHQVQESSREERDESGAHRGQYKNGRLEVTLFQVQLASGGQYVCAMTCDDVHKETIMEVTVEGTINVTAGGVAIFPCHMIETYDPSHLKLQWRRISPGKSKTIYFYLLYWDTCPAVYYGDKFNARCSCSNGPRSRVWLLKDYEQRAEISKSNILGNENVFLKLSNIQEEDAGKYKCSVRSSLLHKVAIYELNVRGVSIAGNVYPEIGQIGQDVILRCQVGGCTSSRLQVHLYKWEGSRNQTLYIHSNTKQHQVQESSREERDESGAYRGQYENGRLEATLFQVQLASGGQYVCAMTCDDVYKEKILEVTVEAFLLLLILMGWYFAKNKEQLKTENDHLKTTIEQFETEKEQLEAEKEQLKTENDHLKTTIEQFETEKEQLEAEKEQLKTENDHLKTTIEQFETEKEQLEAEKEQLKTENDHLKTTIEQLETEKEQLEAEKEFLDAHLYRADVVLDPKTAHPRLEVSEKGKCVRDTGFASKVSDGEERFDSHAFILAAEGFSEGKHYWEVEVGQKEKWDLGVASESAPRKGTITLSPENGYWVMGLDGGKDYLAWTEVWTRLQVTGKLTKIGIFLDIPARSLSFYDVNSRSKLHIYYTICNPGKFYPFFSIGSITSKIDKQPLKIFENNKKGDSGGKKQTSFG
ncbi:uncharacterized protein LOC133367153 isoform X2 [Rhineura floridana]|uniref:uncharacterized protein LOC133367153 isoform X2 n=1 Tax=Rhineura floridana TaxID=261503 RepID=UPI002AC87F29|nr:uncharacterized protein LOC133367153 isoform X2 [Rhineura floridana]